MVEDAGKLATVSPDPRNYAPFLNFSEENYNRFVGFRFSPVSDVNLCIRANIVFISMCNDLYIHLCMCTFYICILVLVIFIASRCH